MEYLYVFLTLVSILGLLFAFALWNERRIYHKASTDEAERQVQEGERPSYKLETKE